MKQVFLQLLQLSFYFAEKLAADTSNIIATRAEPAVFAALKDLFPQAEYHALARMVVIKRERVSKPKGLVAVLTAGTADLPVAEEAALTAEIMGNRVERIYDVGVAGLRRLLHYHQQLEKARVLIVVAGMEGALASVVGGLVSKPIIAVPTSIGYGANFLGLAPLLTMLNSCAPGVSVVNIDNGYGAGCCASLINQLD